MASEKEIEMDKNILISIIVPIYKAERYLHRCVDSIIAQTFTDWELLLIDDGSPDGSGEICDEYAKRDNRIKVLHKENGGVSSARQKGQNKARGEYTIHVDPDDWVEPTMLEDLYNKAKKDDADMVICDYYQNKGNMQTYIKQKPSRLDSDTVLSELFQQLHGSCCNKLVRRACYSGKVKFPEGVNCCEDLIWCVQVLPLCRKISYLDKAYYHYMITESESQSKVISKERSLQDMRMQKTLEALLNSFPEIQKKMFERTIPYVMKRAMKTGCFDSHYFKQNFKEYRKFILCSNSSYMLRFVCFLSAIGGYRFCWPLIRFMR